MNTEVVFIIIVVFLVADFIVERILEWVNMRAMAPVLPENLKGIYDEKEYARFQNYKRETNRFDLIRFHFFFYSDDGVFVYRRFRLVECWV